MYRPAPYSDSELAAIALDCTLNENAARKVGNPADEQQVEPLLERRKETFDHAQHKAKMLRYR